MSPYIAKCPLRGKMAENHCSRIMCWYFTKCPLKCPVQYRRDQRDGKAGRRVSGWGGFGERLKLRASKTWDRCSKEGTERGRSPGDSSKGRQVLGASRKAALVFIACGFHKEAMVASSPQAIWLQEMHQELCTAWRKLGIHSSMKHLLSERYSVPEKYGSR